MGAAPVLMALAAASDVGKTYRLYHKLGNSSRLTPRGSITIAPSSDADGDLVATHHPEENVQLDTMAFDGMVESGALYTLVVLEDGRGKPTSYPPEGHHAAASVPGCSLRRANLREEIGLSIGPTGKLLGVTYRPLVSPLAPKACDTLPPLSANPEAIFGRKEGTDGNGDDSYVLPFKTTVSYDSHKPAMAIPTVLPPGQRPPPGLKWYRRNAKNNPMGPLGGTKEGGIPGVDDDKPTGFRSSFLYRYWYIILPMAIVGLFGGGDEEEVQSRAGGGAAAGGAAAGAVAAGSASQAGRRRGKRD